MPKKSQILANFISKSIVLTGHFSCKKKREFSFAMMYIRRFTVLLKKQKGAVKKVPKKRKTANSLYSGNAVFFVI